MLKPWSQPTEIPAGQRSYRSKAINIYSFKPLVGILLSKQMKTSTVGLNFLYVTGESPAFKKTCEKRLCLETVLKRKSQNLSCCRRKWKHLFIFSGKTGSMRGSLLLWSFQHFSLRARLRPPGPHPSPSLWTVRSADLSRRPPRPACVCSRAAPSPGKGTSTRGTPFLCNSGRPARWALIPPWSEQIPWHWGLLHSPAACTPRGHHPGPSRHHRWCPRSPGQGSPLSRRSDRPRPPGGAVCCLRREKWDNGSVDRGMRRVFCPVGPSLQQ